MSEANDADPIINELKTLIGTNVWGYLVAQLNISIEYCKSRLSNVDDEVNAENDEAKRLRWQLLCAIKANTDLKNLPNNIIKRAEGGETTVPRLIGLDDIEKQISGNA